MLEVWGRHEWGESRRGAGVRRFSSPDSVEEGTSSWLLRCPKDVGNHGFSDAQEQTAATTLRKARRLLTRGHRVMEVGGGGSCGGHGLRKGPPNPQSLGKSLVGRLLRMSPSGFCIRPCKRHAMYCTMPYMVMLYMVLGTLQAVQLVGPYCSILDSVFTGTIHWTVSWPFKLPNRPNLSSPRLHAVQSSGQGWAGPAASIESFDHN